MPLVSVFAGGGLNGNELRNGLHLLNGKRHWLAVIMFFLSSSWCLTFTVVALNVLPNDEAKFIRSPPKFEAQSNRVSWFHVPGVGGPMPFSLVCEASGDPEEYRWFKNGEPLNVDGERIVWDRPGRSGTVTILVPEQNDRGYYQCHVFNIFGTAVSDLFVVKMGFLNPFPKRPVKELHVSEGDSLTLNCDFPTGDPRPTIVWLFRNSKQMNVIETVKREHVMTDGDGNLQFSYVREHDGRKDLIYQCAATSPVLHGLYRMGDEVQLNVTPRSDIIRPVKLLYASPADIRTTAGETLRLTCIFSGYPLPRVRWFKKDSTLPEHRSKTDDFGKTLIFKPVQVEDAGTYTCQAGVEMSYEISVTVTSVPQWVDGPPNDLDAPEDSDAELSCNAIGEPPPVVTWFMNGKPLHETPSNPRRSITNNGQVLTITELNHDIDRGVYQCNVSNQLGYLFANAYINVVAQPPVFKTERDQVVKTILGETVDLDCDVNAAPVPEVVWLKRTEDAERRVLFDGEQLEFLANNTLRLYSVHLSHGGAYYCNVSNKYGVNRGRRILQVYNPTRFLHILDPTRPPLEPNTTLSLSCTAEADSDLTVEYKWFKDDEEIQFDSDSSYRRYEMNRIEIGRARAKHSGVYKCVAKTEVDQIETETRVVVKDVPEAPIITMIDCEQRRASIRWVAAYDNHSPITQYVVEYSTDFSPGQWKNALTEELTNSEKYEALISLSPWVSYSFRVIAVNAYGRGTPAYSQDTKCETPPSSPYTNPIDIRLDSQAPETLGIYWTTMDKEDWNAPDLKYIVRYWPDEPNAQVRTVEVNDPWQDRLIIREVPVYKRYKASIQAANNVGVSIAVLSNVTGYSAEGVPAEAPKNFAFQTVNDTAVRFSWAPVPPATLKGYFQGYKIYYSRYDRDNQDDRNHVSSVIVPSDHTEIVLNVFEALTEYEARMVAFNSRDRESPNSDIIRWRMPEGPAGEVSSFDVKPLGAKTIYSTWSKPALPRGYINSYHLTFAELDENDQVAFSYSAIVTDQTHHHVWTQRPAEEPGPKPKTKYRVSIAAETGCRCLGEMSYRVIWTYPEQHPGKPGLKIQMLPNLMANVTWEPPSDGMPGTAFYANYSTADDDNWLTSSVVYAPQRSVILDKLTVHTEYRVYILATDDKYKTASNIEYFRVVPEPEPRSFRTVSQGNYTKSEQTGPLITGWSGVAWVIAIISFVVIALASILVIWVCQRNRGGKYPVKKKELERGHMLEKDEERTFLEYQYAGGAMSDSTTT